MFRKVLNLFGSAKRTGLGTPATAGNSAAAAADLPIAQGNRAEEKGDFAGAVERYRDAVAVAPAYAKAHMNLGIGREGIGEFDQASRAYETALARDPNEVTANSPRRTTCGAQQGSPGN